MFKSRTDDLSWREIDGEFVLLDERDWQYLHLNGSGALLWPMLIEGTTSAALADRLVESFELDREAAELDVAAFLADLQARELVVEQ